MLPNCPSSNLPNLLSSPSTLSFSPKSKNTDQLNSSLFLTPIVWLLDFFYICLRFVPDICNSFLPIPVSSLRIYNTFKIRSEQRVYKTSSSCPCPQSPLVPLPEGNQDEVERSCIPWEILSARGNKQFTQNNLKTKLAIPFPVGSLPFTSSWVSRTFLPPADLLSVPNDRFLTEINPALGLFLTCSFRLGSFSPGLCLLVPSWSITSLESTHSLPKPVIPRDRGLLCVAFKPLPQVKLSAFIYQALGLFIDHLPH